MEFGAIDVSQARLNRSGMSLPAACVLASHCSCQVTVRPRVSMDQSAVTALNGNDLVNLLTAGLSSYGVGAMQTSEIAYQNGGPRVKILFTDLTGDDPCRVALDAAT